MSAEKTGLALSVRQPWAWAIVHGHKPIENRGWSTKLRGWIGIHAGQRFDAEGYAWLLETFPEIVFPAPDEYERGGIVGRAYLAGVATSSTSRWFFGPFGLVLRDAEPLPFVSCAGRLGFFRPDLATPASSTPHPSEL